MVGKCMRQLNRNIRDEENGIDALMNDDRCELNKIAGNVVKSLETKTMNHF